MPNAKPNCSAGGTANFQEWCSDVQHHHLEHTTSRVDLLQWAAETAAAEAPNPERFHDCVVPNHAGLQSGKKLVAKHKLAIHACFERPRCSCGDHEIIFYDVRMAEASFTGLAIMGTSRAFIFDTGGVAIPMCMATGRAYFSCI